MTKQKKALLLIPLILFLWIPVLPAAGKGENRMQSLKIGLMPAVDIAPIYLARDRGLFAEEGLEIELSLFTNAQNRQTALQTGQIDGALSDLIALITNVESGFPLKGTLSTDGVFPVLFNHNAEGEVIAPGSRLTAGLMEISVANYLMEQYLGATHTLEKVYINEIPVRLEAVASGRLQSGLFPEPIASIGALRGLEKVVYEGIPRQSVDIMVFTRKTLEEKRSEIAAFHRGYARAVKLIQEDPSLAKEVIAAYIPNLPPGLEDHIVFPDYAPPRLPDNSFISEIILWTSGVTGREISLLPEDILDRTFLDR
jgi:NitT/TauT family transport system substrate-binding protein